MPDQRATELTPARVDRHSSLPEVGQALDGLAGKISDAEMQRMNYAVDGEHRDVKDVVREFLRGKGLE